MVSDGDVRPVSRGAPVLGAGGAVAAPFRKDPNALKPSALEYKVRWFSQHDIILEALFSGLKVGTLKLARVDDSAVKKSLREDFRSMRVGFDNARELPLYCVRSAELDSEFQGKGIGYQMYREAFKFLAKHGGAWVCPDSNMESGQTSKDAMKVWQFLSERFDGNEYFLIVRPNDVVAATDPPKLNDAFWAWFGQSKVVDQAGNPLVVYTGTSKDVDFKAFNIKQRGAWFTEDRNSASQYAMDNDSQTFKREGWDLVKKNTMSRVIPAYLKIENPWEPTAKDIEDWRDKFPHLRERPDGYKKVEREMLNHVRTSGHDGIKMPGGVWVVLNDPAQIKSALGNRGTWDPSNKNIDAAADDDDYQMTHRPPDSTDGAPLHDLTANGVYPKDVYETLHHYRSGDPTDLEVQSIVRSTKGLPDRRVWVYRAVPRGVKKINPGDWVTISKDYAKQHARHESDPSLDMDVIARRTEAKNLHTNGDSLQEWGYNGSVALNGFLSYRPRRRKPADAAALLEAAAQQIEADTLLPRTFVLKLPQVAKNVIWHFITALDSNTPEGLEKKLVDELKEMWSTRREGSADHVTMEASPGVWLLFANVCETGFKKYDVTPLKSASKKIRDALAGKKRPSKSKSVMSEIQIAGQRVFLNGFNEDDRYCVAGLRFAQSVIEHSIDKIRHTYGIHAEMPAIEVSFKKKPPAQASYYVGQNKIIWYANGNNNHDTKRGLTEGIKTFAHEFGHFVLSNYVDSKARRAWIDLVEADKLAVSLADIGRAWHEGESVSSFFERLKEEDPLMAIKVEYAMLYAHKGSTLPTRAELLRSTKVLRLSQHPISPYGHTDPEESFCEAFGQYIAYGPNTVHPLVRSWMRIVLPESKIQANVTAANGETFNENTRKDREYGAHPDMSVPPYDRRNDSGCFAVMWLTQDGVIFSSRCRDLGQALRMTRQHKRVPTWVLTGLERELDTAQMCLTYQGQDWLDANHMDKAVRRAIDVVATQNLPTPSKFIQPKLARR